MLVIENLNCADIVWFHRSDILLDIQSSKSCIQLVQLANFKIRYSSNEIWFVE